ncbi:hypothetical protein ADK53_23235, partial [Streptomyces sp. WM6373]
MAGQLGGGVLGVVLAQAERGGQGGGRRGTVLQQPGVEPDRRRTEDGGIHRSRAGFGGRGRGRGRGGGRG